MTLIGALLIPIAIICFFWSPAHLLALLIVVSVFEAATVFNGGIDQFVFGVSPYYFVGMLVILRLTWSYWISEKQALPAEAPAKGIVRLLLYFLAWCCVSALLMPRLFAGMPVYAPRAMEDADMLAGSLVPLNWSLSNLAQIAYLSINVGVVLFAVRLIDTIEQLDLLAKALRWAVIIVVFTAFLQHLAVIVGWQFPYDALVTNPNNPFDASVFDQQIDGFLRISSTFAGPVYAGSFLAATAIGLLASYLLGRRTIAGLMALLLALVALLDTTSTTGYISVVIMLLPLLLYFNPFQRRAIALRGALLWKWTLMGITAMCLLGLALVCLPSLSQAVMAMTVDKPQGISFASRLAADWDAFLIFKNTHGFGAGMGSSRHSSLLLNLLATVGIVGTALFGLIVFKVIKLLPPGWPARPLQMSFWCLMTLLVAESIAVPEINRPTLWVLLMLVIVQCNVFRTLPNAMSASQA